MSEDYSLYEKIDFYLKGDLSSEDRAAFIQEIEQDESLLQKVESQEIANAVVLTKQLLRLKGKINKDLKNRNYFRKYKWLFPIILAALLLPMGMFWNKDEVVQKPVIETAFLSKAPENSLSTIRKADNIASITLSKKPVIANKNILSIPSTLDSSAAIADEEIKQTEFPSPISNTSAINQTKINAQSRIDCSKLSIEEALVTEASCIGEQNGKIIINTSKITGGTAPYLFSISKNIIYKNEDAFLYLNSGNYLLSVKDKHGCSSQKEIEVSEKVCATANSYVFSPDFESWEIPFKQNKGGEIKIFNKSGILVYNSTIGIGHENSWDGKSLEGKIAESGYFVFVLKYNDGEEERGSVTIR